MLEEYICALQETPSETNLRLGKIPVQYEIKLRSDSQPFAISTPQRVSVPLLEIVRSELQQMEDLGLIRKVENPRDGEE